MKRLVAKYSLPSGIALAAVGANPFPAGPGHYGWVVFNPTLWTPADYAGAAGVSVEGVESPVQVAYLSTPLQLRVQDNRILSTNDVMLNQDLNSWWVEVRRADRLIVFVGTRAAINVLPRYAFCQANEFLHGCEKVFRVES